MHWNPRRHHARGIDHQPITFPEVCPDIADVAMLNAIFVKMDHHHPSRIARFRWMSRNEFWVEFKIELIGGEAHP